MSALSQRMDNAMVLRGLADKTREAHLTATGSPLDLLELPH